MVKVGIFGGTGYGGIELIRLLSLHKEVTVEVVTSEHYQGHHLVDVLPFLASCSPDHLLRGVEEGIKGDMDIAFLALPHTVSMDVAKALHDRGVKVIDLSTDFRLKDVALYEEVYGVSHGCPELVAHSEYGMVELFRESIKESPLIAVPGCFPTSVILPVYPLLKEGAVAEDGIIADCKTGVSGAGRSPKESLHYPEVEGGISAYGFPRHRHTSEMNQILSRGIGENVQITFVPHLVPMVRGILATIYLKVGEHVTAKEIREIYHSYYGKEHFIRLLCPGSFPSTKHVRGTNFCDIGFSLRGDTGYAVVVCAIDNLVKGASGAAVQCMNAIIGVDETTSLVGCPLFP